MSKELKDGVYKTSDPKNRITYFVHDGLIGMQWKYGTFKTSSNFMMGAKWVEPLPMTSGEFIKTYNKLDRW